LSRARGNTLALLKVANTCETRYSYRSEGNTFTEQETMKLTKRNRKKYKSEPSAYELMWQRVDSLALEGKRYPLEAGRIFRCHGERGIYKVQYIVQNREDNEKYEIHCWWQSTKQATPTMKGELRCVRPEHVKNITGEIR